MSEETQTQKPAEEEEQQVMPGAPDGLEDGKKWYSHMLDMVNDIMKMVDSGVPASQPIPEDELKSREKFRNLAEILDAEYDAQDAPNPAEMYKRVFPDKKEEIDALETNLDFWIFISQNVTEPQAKAIVLDLGRDFIQNKMQGIAREHGRQAMMREMFLQMAPVPENPS